MPVWFLTSRLEYGGLERVQLNLAQALRRRGYEIRLVTGKLVAALHEAGLWGSPVMEIAPRGPWYFPFGLWRALNNHRPEIVFTTSNDIACMVLLARSIAFRSMRVVVTQHLSVSAPRRKAQGLHRIKLELIRLTLRWLITRADRVIAVSHAVALDMHRELRIDLQRIAVIYNPIVTPDFGTRMNAAAVWPWSNRDVPTAVFVGRLSSEKRLDLLLAAFRELARTCPARLLIVGAGPLESRLREWILTHELAETCSLSGFVPDPLPLIRMADVLTLPSDFEGFGNVLVEAMACGTQVIATDCPCGPAEILQNGMYGQLVPCDDVPALARAMRRAFAGEFKIAPERLQRRAENFSLARSVDAYQNIVDSLART